MYFFEQAFERKRPFADVPQHLVPFARFLAAVRPADEARQLAKAFRHGCPTVEQAAEQLAQQLAAHTARGRAHFQAAAEDLYAFTREDPVVPGPDLSAVADSKDDVNRRKVYWKEREEETFRCAVAGRRHMAAVAPTQVKFTRLHVQYVAKVGGKENLIGNKSTVRMFCHPKISGYYGRA